MSSPSLAVGWSIWQRHRRGLIATPALFAAAALLTALAHSWLDADAAPQVSAFAWGALVIAACYLAAVFSYGFDADLATAGTCFPARMFTLPVRTVQLSGWPMLGGVAFLGLLWLGTAGLILCPWGYVPPLVWPALLGAAMLVWSQALLWWPFGLPWLRVVAGVLLLHLPVTGTLILLQFRYSDKTLTAFLAASLLLGTIVAHLGVARARRGTVPSWGWLALGRRARPSLGRDGRFASARQAQSWFEWRRTGLALPMIVAPFLLISLGPVFIEGIDPPSILLLLTAALLTPVYIAGLAAGAGNKNNPWARDPNILASFIGTRPVSTAELIAAKLRAAARTTLVTWALVLAAVGLTLWLSGHHRLVRPLAAAWIDTHPLAQVIAAVFVVCALLLLTTWRRQVESRLLGLTGRDWIGKFSVILGLILFVAGLMFVSWFANLSQYYPWLIDAIPWVLGTLVALKLAFGGAAIYGLRRCHLMTDRTLAIWGAAWLIAFATFFGLLRWLVPISLAPTHTLAMGVILMLPLARFAAMPLALHWNRHR
jgi:hypothetical protein